MTRPVMRIARLLVALAAAVVVLGATCHGAHAVDDRALDANILSLSEEWAAAKYLSKDHDEINARMADLALRADALVARYPGRAEPLIWSGIINGERASLAWGVTALRLATRARDSLLEAEKIDPTALDAAAPTTLGVLYCRVPRFPIGWGDAKTARQYLEIAVANAPHGREAHYYYAEFLYAHGEYREAERELIKASMLPSHPERPVWDKHLVQMIHMLLASVREKLKS